MRISSLLVALACLLPQAAQAVERAGVIAVGRNSSGAAAVVEREMKARFEVVAADEIAAALAASGHTPHDLTRAAAAQGPMAPGMRGALAGTPLEALAVVASSRSAVHVVVFELDGGTRVLDTWFRTGRRGRINTGRLRDEARRALASWPADEPTPAPASASEASLAEPARTGLAATTPDARVDARPDRRPTLLRARLFYGLGGRQFSFHQPLSRRLRDYSLTAASTVAAEVEAYPLIEGVGLLGSFSIAPGLSSTLADTGEKVSSSWLDWQVGARARLGLGAVALGVTLTYGQLAFTFGGPADPAIADELPGVRYAYGRAALAMWYALDATWQLHGELGYRQLFSVGELGERFPRDEAGGVDAKLGVIYALTRSFSALAEARYVHNYHAFHPVPGDTNVAGGALDLFPALYLGLQYAL